MKNANEFGQFIEELRISRNIEREDFVEGVVSIRHYYRFINGETSLNNETINLLLEKLEISSIFAYERFKKKTDTNYSNLINVYNEVYKNNFSMAEKAFKTITLSDLSSAYNIKIYNFIKIRLDLHYSRITKENSIQKVLELMDYPNILEKDTLSFVELSCIMFVQHDLIDRNDYRITSYTYDILSKNEKLHSTEHKNYMMPFQLSTIKNLGRIGEHEQSLDLAQKLIEEFELFTALNIYASAIYFKALNERDLFKDDRYKVTLTDLFCLLKSQKNKQFGNDFKVQIRESFNIVESDLIIYKVKKNRSH
jgi:transcriptional regulator with XRE-family HTH domain